MTVVGKERLEEEQRRGLWTRWRTRRFGDSFVALFGKSRYRWNPLLVSLALSLRYKTCLSKSLIPCTVHTFVF